MKRHFQTFTHTLLVVALLLPLFSSGAPASAATPAQSSNPLRGYWRFEQNLLDSSPNHNDGSGTASYEVGISGSGLARNGTETPILLPTFGNNGSLNLADSSITIEAWVKSSNFGDDFRHIIDNVDGYALSIFEGRLAMLGPELWWMPINTTGPNSAPLSNPLLNLNTWHYVAGTYDGSKQALYVDGQLVAYRSTSASVPSGQGNIGIGGYGGGGYDYLFRGVIDELRVFDYARPAAAIAANYEDLTSSSPVQVRITDSLGNPVSGLSLNSEGWPTPNPLTVTVTLNCPQGGSSCSYPVFTLDVYALNGAPRFYVYSYSTDPNNDGIAVGCDTQYSGSSNGHSFYSYSADCVTLDTGVGINLDAGQMKIMRWNIWVQPSDVAELRFTASLGASQSNGQIVHIPKARIYPIIFIPGLGATNPPTFNRDYHDTVKTDLLLLGGSAVGYSKMYSALEKLGYERNRTYFLFPYDWLLATPYVAERLRNEMIVPASAEIATTVPWVAGYGSPDGQDVKFDLIGHSTGNLVARAYIQGADVTGSYDLWVGHVRRFVSLAGPHKGLPKGYTLLEGAASEAQCDNPVAADYDISCLAFMWGASRAEKAKYGKRVPHGRFVWNIEDKYLFLHDPLYERLRSGNNIVSIPSSVDGFLPTYSETPYLAGASGDFPYGRLANPLLEPASVRGPVPGGEAPYYIYDPYSDNSYAMGNLRKRYGITDYQSVYYGLNTLDRMQLMYSRIGDAGSSNVCLIYGGGDFIQPNPQRTVSSDTRVQIDVLAPQRIPPYWIRGSRLESSQDRYGNGDRFVPGMSGGATDIWVGDLLVKNRGFDLDIDLQDTGKTAEHGALVSYGITHEHIAECLVGIVPSFLLEDSESGSPIARSSRVGILAAPAKITSPAAVIFKSALVISARGPVELTLTDAQGRRLGYDPNVAAPWAEIPDALYTDDIDLGFKYLFIWSPIVGDYALTITGSSIGDYVVLSNYYDSSALINLFIIDGQAASGSSQTAIVTVPSRAIDVPQPPEVLAGPDLVANEGEAAIFSGTFTDINSGDTHQYRWDFGDGTLPAEGTLTPIHTYADNGEYVVTLTVTDSTGFEVDDTLTVNVQYAFSGFFQPVDNLPTLNTVKAGSSVPVKFSLGGNQGLTIFATGYPSSSTVSCGSTAEDAIEETMTAGSSGLLYDPSTGQYTYIWKTDKAWAGTCRTLVVKLADGTYHRANFKFK